MPATRHCRVLIIGSGPAGYTAAIYAARADLQPILIQGLDVGGQMSITTDVENYPGFADVIQGPWLMEQMAAQAAHCGTELVTDSIVGVDLGRRPFRCVADSGDVYVAEALILATGAQARWLGLPSETRFRGFGVSACATCDGFFFRGRPVAVIGGGNTAVEEALYLSKLASSRDPDPPPRPAARREGAAGPPVRATPRSSMVWDSVLDEVLGHDQPPAVTGIRTRNVAQWRVARASRSRACSSRSAMIRPPSWSRDSSRWTPTAT